MKEDKFDEEQIPYSAKRCWACREQLQHEDMLKCIQCQSWQNWRRYLLLSSSMLALMVSALSISIVTTPLFLDQIKPKNGWIEVGKIEGPFLDNLQEKLYFTAENKGRGPAVLMSPFFNVFDPSEEDPKKAYWWSVLDTPPYIDGSKTDGRVEALELKAGEFRIIQIAGPQKWAGRNIDKYLKEISKTTNDYQQLRCFFSFKHLPLRSTADPMAAFQSRFPKSEDLIPRAYSQIDGRVFAEVDCWNAQIWAQTVSRESE